MPSIIRGDLAQIPFSITSAGGGLQNMRVTAAFARNIVPYRQVLRKQSGVPGSSAEVTVTSQTNTQIVGMINMLAADYTTLLDTLYVMTLWIDDNAGNQRAVSTAGYETLTILPAVPRTP